MLDRLKHLLVDVRSGGQLHDLEVHAALSQCVPQLQRFRQGLAVDETHGGEHHVDCGLRAGLVVAHSPAKGGCDGLPKYAHAEPGRANTGRNVDLQDCPDEVHVAVFARGMFGHWARSSPLAEHDRDSGQHAKAALKDQERRASEWNLGNGVVGVPRERKTARPHGTAASRAP